MSVTVDDLVSSFGSGMSVGQEAVDLAALQAQLTQSFFGQPSFTSNPGWDIPRHCTTPTRTPSSSFSCGSVSPMIDVSHRPRWEVQADSTSTRNLNDDMDEDERAVEEFLMSSSPSPMQSANQFSFASQQSSQNRNRSSSRGRLPSRALNAVFSPATSPSASYTDSCFTSTDPFYIAQVQAQTVATQPRSFFQSPSPFATQQLQQPQLQFGQVSGGNNAATSFAMQTQQFNTPSAFDRRDLVIDTRM